MWTIATTKKGAKFFISAESEDEENLNKLRLQDSKAESVYVISDISLVWLVI